MSRELTTFCVSQPDGLTCGPSSLFSACLSLMGPDSSPETRGFIHVPRHLSSAPIKELGGVMGTCHEFGTRHIEMERGLKFVGLPVIRGVLGVPVLSDSPHDADKAERHSIMSKLSDTLEDNIVILRTAWHGCKHWVLVVGSDNNGLGFHVMEPSSGRLLYVTTDELHKFWSDRGYDCFVVSKSEKPSNKSFLKSIIDIMEVTSDIRAKADEVFKQMPVTKQMEFTSMWRVCQTKIEDYSLEMAPIKKKRGPAKKNTPTYHVHHMIAKVRETFYGLMVLGKSPQECKDDSLKEWGII